MIEGEKHAPQSPRRLIMGDPESPPVQESAPASGPSHLHWAALIFACLTAVGSLVFSLLVRVEGNRLRSCLLCIYQRTYVFAIVALLATGLFLRQRRAILFALPLALAAVGVSLFQNGEELLGIVECPKGLLGLGTVPNQ